MPSYTFMFYACKKYYAYKKKCSLITYHNIWCLMLLWYEKRKLLSKNVVQKITIFCFDNNFKSFQGIRPIFFLFFICLFAVFCSKRKPLVKYLCTSGMVFSRRAYGFLLVYMTFFGDYYKDLFLDKHNVCPFN